MKCDTKQLNLIKKARREDVLSLYFKNCYQMIQVEGSIYPAIASLERTIATMLRKHTRNPRNLMILASDLNAKRKPKIKITRHT